MIAVNSGQQQPPVVPYVARRNPNQIAMANAAKAVADEVLRDVCLQTRDAALDCASVVCSTAPTAARVAVVNSGIINIGTEVRQAVHAMIDSDVCYGNEDSCISKTTNWIKDQA